MSVETTGAACDALELSGTAGVEFVAFSLSTPSSFGSFESAVPATAGVTSVVIASEEVDGAVVLGGEVSSRNHSWSNHAPECPLTRLRVVTGLPGHRDRHRRHIRVGFRVGEYTSNLQLLVVTRPSKARASPFGLFSRCFRHLPFLSCIVWFRANFASFCGRSSGRGSVEAPDATGVDAVRRCCD